MALQGYVKHGDVLVPVGGSSVPVGCIVPFAGTGKVPVGFLVCNGAVINKNTYPDLFNAIGYTYGGSGDYFWLPNLVDRFVLGKNATAGETGGTSSHYHSTANHTLTTNEMPSHSHRDMMWGENTGNYFGVNPGNTNNSIWTFSYTGTAGQANFYTSRTGGGAGHNHGNTSDTSNIPPYITLRYIIRAFAGASTGTTDVSITNLANEVSGKASLAGGTFYGILRNTYQSGTWINSAKNSVISLDNTGYGGWICGPAKDGRIAISSYPANNNNLYFGYATTAQISAGTNAFNQTMYWDAANNNLHATTFTGTATSAYYADYAEWFPKGEEETEQGDIIALDENSDKEVYIKATDKSICVVGVHSETYGYSVGGELTPDGEDYREYQKTKYIPVGLAGRLPVKFIGRSQKGGKVVPSAIPGIGRLYNKETDDYESIIGYLVESDDINDTKTVRLLKMKIK